MKLKIDLRPGTKLSEHFSNRQDCYKVVEVDHILGYVVSGGGRESAASIHAYTVACHAERLDVVSRTWQKIRRPSRKMWRLSATCRPRLRRLSTPSPHSLWKWSRDNGRGSEAR